MTRANTGPVSVSAKVRPAGHTGPWSNLPPEDPHRPRYERFTLDELKGEWQADRDDDADYSGDEGRWGQEEM